MSSFLVSNAKVSGNWLVARSMKSSMYLPYRRLIAWALMLKTLSNYIIQANNKYSNCCRDAYHVPILCRQLTSPQLDKASLAIS